MNVVVRARIDKRVKADAAEVLASIGLTVSDAFRLMMVRIAIEKKLPFEPLVPNAWTVAAMRAARRGDLRCGWPDRRPQCGRLGVPPPSNATTNANSRVRLGSHSELGL